MEDDRELLRQTYELARENNKLLKKLRRAELLNMLLRIVFWAVVLGVPVALYYFFARPYVEGLVEAYHALQSGAENVEELRQQAAENLKHLLRFFGVSVE